MELKDRINAVIRTPEYKKAYDQCHMSAKPGTQPRFALSGHNLHLWPLSPEFQKICTDFKIPVPLSPHSPIVLEDFFSVIPVSRMEAGECIVGPDEDHCMHVKIDLTQPLEKIQDEIGHLYRKHVKGKRHTRNKDNAAIRCSIWDVYDLVSKEGLSLYEVARRFGMTGVPKEGNYSADATYSRYKHAYNKAKKIVGEVQKGFL